MGLKEIKEQVKERYGKIAKTGGFAQAKGCGCGCSDEADRLGKNIGYSQEEVSSVPKDSDLGLGCGNPVAIASLKEGETVLDLGSGAGFDCFLASKKVGKTGKIIGVDMTPGMIQKARDNAKKGAYSNVEFRQGEIESLPVDTGSVDAIISNCVINLSPDKKKVFAEAYRVLKPGGRVMISDLVLISPLSEKLAKSVAAYTACLGGAMLKEKYLELIRDTGFKDVKIMSEIRYGTEMLHDSTAQSIAEELEMNQEEALTVAEKILSVRVSGVKPENI